MAQPDACIVAAGIAVQLLRGRAARFSDGCDQGRIGVRAAFELLPDRLVELSWKRGRNGQLRLPRDACVRCLICTARAYR